jgi:hypothetical protein
VRAPGSGIVSTCDESAADRGATPFLAPSMSIAPTTSEQFFQRSPIGLALYRALADIIASIGLAETTVSKSQISFRVSQEVRLCLAT